MKAYTCDNCGYGKCYVFDMGGAAYEVPAKCAYHYSYPYWDEIDINEAITAIQERREYEAR